MENPLEDSENWRLLKGPDGMGNPPVGAGKPPVGKEGRPEGIGPWGAGRARAQPIKPMRVKLVYFIVGRSSSVVYFVK